MGLQPPANSSLHCSISEHENWADVLYSGRTTPTLPLQGEASTPPRRGIMSALRAAFIIYEIYFLNNLFLFIGSQWKGQK